MGTPYVSKAERHGVPRHTCAQGQREAQQSDQCANVHASYQLDKVEVDFLMLAKSRRLALMGNSTEAKDKLLRSSKSG